MSMKLLQAGLQNFRSYTKTSFVFSPQTTIIIGPNTSGKTNLLEAVYLAAVGTSFRAEKDSDMIYWKEEIARVRLNTQGPGLKSDQNELEVVITTGLVSGQTAPGKRFFLNSIAKRFIDFAGNLKAVLFWPEDLELVVATPSLRRRYLDFVLTQVDREYRRSLFSYEKGIRQRNKLLERIRDGFANRNQLLFWDQLVIKTGNYLTTKRAELISFINAATRPFGDFSLKYDLSVISESRLNHYADAEIAAAVTLVGPHRDDFQFLEKERNLAKFGSRGEQRLAVLWLKLAELDFIEHATHERSVLLLDDIFSELDHRHREEVMQIMPKQQTILTTTDVHFLPEKLLKDAKVVELDK